MRYFIYLQHFTFTLTTYNTPPFLLIVSNKEFSWKLSKVEFFKLWRFIILFNNKVNSEKLRPKVFKIYT